MLSTLHISVHFHFLVLVLLVVLEEPADQAGSSVTLWHILKQVCVQQTAAVPIKLQQQGQAASRLGLGLAASRLHLLKAPDVLHCMGLPPDLQQPVGRELLDVGEASKLRVICMDRDDLVVLLALLSEWREQRHR